MFQLALAPTEMRLNDYYTKYYNHAMRIIFTGAIPLVALVYFNYRVYAAFQLRRRNMRGRDVERMSITFCWAFLGHLQ